MAVLTKGLRKCSLVVAVVAMTLLFIAATANAEVPTDRWLTLDANLKDWGVDPGTGDWTPNKDLVGNCIYALDDDETFAGTRSGGEWYDIEALYIKIGRAHV